jgi:hypothetical protein
MMKREMGCHLGEEWGVIVFSFYFFMASLFPSNFSILSLLFLSFSLGG